MLDHRRHPGDQRADQHLQAGDVTGGRQHSQRSPGRAPIRSSEARAEASSAAAVSSTPFGAPVDPEVAITTACLGPDAAAGWPRPARPGPAACVPFRWFRWWPGRRPRAARPAGSRGRSGSSGRIAGPLPSSAADSAASRRPPAAEREQDRVQGPGRHGRKVNRADQASPGGRRVIDWKARAGGRQDYTDIGTRRPRVSPRSPSTGPRCATRSGRRRCSSCRHAFNVARDDPEIGVIILTGAGDKAFCSGGDQKIRGDDGYVDSHGVGRLNVLDLQVQIRRTPKPVIAMVAGYAIGGGHVLHVCCDLTIAADNAIFGQTGPQGRLVRRRLRLVAAGGHRRAEEGARDLVPVPPVQRAEALADGPGQHRRPAGPAGGGDGRLGARDAGRSRRWRCACSRAR